MNVERKQFWLGLVWALLLIAIASGYWAMRRSAGRLQAAQLQTQECQKMASEIAQLRDRPGFAALDIDSPRTITARAEEASKLAKLSPTSLVRIEPQAAMRLRDSPYRLRPTRLELRGVTLTQIINFTHAMIDESQGTTVRDLRLTLNPPKEGPEPETRADGHVDRWTAELVLTQLIFSPPAAKSAGTAPNGGSLATRL